ncbi:hypothetical protein [Shinella sp.]|uniref:hypothetical protein n=1 Tax=Shinella sp. TaxID=1870904 RepID=UPI003F70766F
MITYFVVQSFSIQKKGAITADPPFQTASAAQAVRTAERLSEHKTAVFAFSRTGDPATGDYDPAEILCSFGELPEGVEYALAA